MWRLAIS
jgi:hypothetical protein